MDNTLIIHKIKKECADQYNKQEQIDEYMRGCFSALSYIAEALKDNSIPRLAKAIELRGPEDCIYNSDKYENEDLGVVSCQYCPYKGISVFDQELGDKQYCFNPENVGRYNIIDISKEKFDKWEGSPEAAFLDDDNECALSRARKVWKIAFNMGYKHLARKIGDCDNCKHSECDCYVEPCKSCGDRGPNLYNACGLLQKEKDNIQERFDKIYKELMDMAKQAQMRSV